MGVLKKHPLFDMLSYGSLKRRGCSFGWCGSVLSRQVPRYMKMPPTKDQVLQLVDACQSAGAKLAVALAAFSGLGPGQVKRLVFRDRGDPPGFSG